MPINSERLTTQTRRHAEKRTDVLTTKHTNLTNSGRRYFLLFVNVV